MRTAGAAAKRASISTSLTGGSRGAAPGNRFPPRHHAAARDRGGALMSGFRSRAASIPMMKPEPLAEDIQSFAQNIVDTVREPLLILDVDLRVRSANRAFYQTFKVSPDD